MSERAVAVWTVGVPHLPADRDYEARFGERRRAVHLPFGYRAVVIAHYDVGAAIAVEVADPRPSS